MPPAMEYFLSLNLKHLFHTIPDFSLPFEAFKLLQRSVRIKWMMRNKPDDGFLPQFHTKSDDFVPPHAHPTIEAGLEKGKEELFRQLPSVFPIKDHRHPRRDHIKVSEAKQFMTVNHYLSLITDKNLGIAVVTEDWYSSELEKHLSDDTTYEIVRRIPWHTIESGIFDIDNWDCFTPQISEYLRLSPERSVPTFYGIPKIHKTPWALRPILPCHKWILAHVSKVLDFHLQPLLKLYPWVLQSTASFCKAIDSVDLSQRSGLRLCTGDVKSMYTNISRNTLMERLVVTLGAHEETYPPELQHVLIQMVILVNDNCFFNSNGKLYHQRRGLAMGVSCAPTLANLYLALLEKKKRPLRTGTAILYVRYIDDIFAIYDPQDMSTFVKDIPRDEHLEVIWEESDSHLDFLDVAVRLHPHDRQPRLTTAVRGKNLNHYQYIPWSSAHPKNVKKAFVKGELTRYRTICSEEEGFYKQKGLLHDHLRARGYPEKVLRSWLQLVNYGDTRFPIKAPVDAPWMLPSHYNSAWDFILVKQIREAMVKEWAKAAPPSFIDRRLITSFKRTMSLFDHTRIWNRDVLDDDSVI